MGAAKDLPRALRRRLRSDAVLRRWTVAWLGGSVLGVANGVTREALYSRRVGERAANQISAGTLNALLALYFAALELRWPLATTRAALEVGAVWVALTVLFEFGFGHWIDRKSWAELLANYDIAAGNLWLLVLVWIGAGPAVARAVHRRGAGGAAAQ